MAAAAPPPAADIAILAMKDHFWGASTLKPEQYLHTGGTSSAGPHPLQPSTPKTREAPDSDLGASHAGEEGAAGPGAAATTTTLRGYDILTRHHRDSKRVLKQTVSFLADVAVAEEIYAKALAKAVAKASVNLDVELESMSTSLASLVDVVQAYASQASARADTLNSEILPPMRSFKEDFKNEPRDDIRIEAKLYKELVSLRASLPKLADKYHAKSLADENLQVSTVEIVNSSILSSAEVMKLTDKQVKAVKEANAARSAYTKAVDATTDLVKRYNAHVEVSCDRFEALERKRARHLAHKLDAVTHLFTDPVAAVVSAESALAASIAALDTDADIQYFIRCYRTSSQREALPQFVPYVSILNPGHGDEAAQPPNSHHPATAPSLLSTEDPDNGAAAADRASQRALHPDAAAAGRNPADRSRSGSDAAAVTHIPVILPSGMSSSTGDLSWRGSPGSSGSLAVPAAVAAGAGAGACAVAGAGAVAVGGSGSSSLSPDAASGSSVVVSQSQHLELKQLPPFPPLPDTDVPLRRSLINFTARDAYELSLFVDDVIHVLAVHDSGWWLGRVGTEVGVFYSKATVGIDRTLLV